MDDTFLFYVQVELVDGINGMHFLFTQHMKNVHVLQVYFLWICPSHRSFEWFVDVLRDVERKDITNVLEMHIFITQFFHKFDLRTTMLVSHDLLAKDKTHTLEFKSGIVLSFSAGGSKTQEIS